MKKSAIALLAGLLIFLLLLIFVGGRASDADLFLGRLHPALVHLPIGILLVAALLEAWNRHAGGYDRAVLALLYCGAWSAFLAASAGLYLAKGGGYDPTTFAWHKRMGVLVALVATGAYLLKLQAFAGLRPSTLLEKRGYLYSIAGLVLVIGLTGHLGAELTHGSGYLTRYMPDGIRTLIGLPEKEDIGRLQLENPAEATIYSALVEPILERRCVSCHGESASRGGLRLDSPEAIFEGGDAGPAVVAGRSEESELVYRIWLPLASDEHMPPEGRPQPTVAEAEILRWWIDSGASLEETLPDADITPVVQSILDGYGLDEIRTGIFALDVSMPSDDDVAALAETGVSAVPLAENEPFLQVRCTDPAACSGEAFREALVRLPGNIAWLDLGRTDVGDEILPAVGSLRHLTRLHLQQTRVTDAGLEHLSNLEYLEYLNLYGTSVTDSGLAHLEGLASLRSLYLWQSEATEAGAAALNEVLPDLEINLGLELAPDTTQSEE